MGKKGKKKARSVHKDKQVSVASPKTVSQNCISNTETPNEEVVVAKEKRVCPHLDQGIDVEKVSTKIKSSDPLRCEDCREGVVDRRAGKEKAKGKKKGGGVSKSDSKAIWVCLQCGHFACGGAGFPTTRQSHAVRHSSQHRHPLAIQFENPQLRWCFRCSTIIPVEKSDDNSEQKDVLHDLAKLIKGRSSEGPKIDVEETWFGSGSVTSGIKSETSVSIVSGVNGSYMVRGLVNLGNTCFFNSVMQNLLAMDKLRDYFSKLDGSLGPLTASLKKLYIETIPEAGPKGVVNPRSFFGCVCVKAPQFRGYQQHDSHELLRCLLDALCTEESSAKKQIKYSQEDEKSPQNDSTFVDLIFGGQLSSTVSCLECGHSSTVYEPFLDLSLPVPTKKPPSRKAPPVSRAKKQKPPPRRSGKNISKVKKDANIYPANRVADQITGGKSVLQLQSVPTVVEQSVGSSAASVLLGTSIAAATTDETQLVSQNPVGAQDVGSKQGTEDVCGDMVTTGDSAWLDYLEPDLPLEDYHTVTQTAEVSVDQGCGTENAVLSDSLLQKTLGSSAETASTCLDAAPCSDDMTWLDFCEAGNLSDHGGIATQINVELTSEEARTNNVVVSDVNKHSSESCKQVSFDDSNVVVGSSGKLWEDEIPMQVQDSPVILLPYKEDTSVSEIFIGEEVSSSAVGCDPEEFGGLGDLFNEPEAVTEPSAKALTSSNSSETNAPAHAGILVGHSSESDPDEVDNSNAAVSVDSCLSYFVKPELLSKDEHAWQCENCSKVLLEEKVRLRKKMLLHNSDTVINLNGGSSSGAFFLADENHPSSSGLERLSNGITEKDVFDSNHDSEQPHDEETNYTNFVVKMSEKAELEPVASENGKPEMEDAPQSSNSEKPSCEKSNSNEISEQVGSNSLTVNSQSQESEDEEIDSKKLKVKRDATKRILINRAPPILTIHLKRFSQDARGRLSKLNGHVDFRDTINLKPYVDPRCIDRDRYKYRLLGVVEHSGTMRGGHYVAYVRGGRKNTDTSENGSDNFTWYHASDAYVHETTLEEVLRCEAYILFYEQI